MKLGYLARDQYGQCEHLTDVDAHPRGKLLRKLGVPHCAKMYVDSVSTGKTKHVGYVVGGRLFNLYEVHSWEGGAA